MALGRDHAGDEADGRTVLWGSRADPDPTPAVVAAVALAGVLALRDAVDLPVWPVDVDVEQRRDLLCAAGLHVQGSPVVWAPQRCWLTRPVVQLLVAAGPQPVAELMIALGRARHQTRPRRALPDLRLLMPWARAHPELLVRGRLVGLAAPARAELALSATDRLLLDALRGQPAGVAAGGLSALLRERSGYRSPGAAQTRLASVPYLRPVTAAGQRLLTLPAARRHATTWADARRAGARGVEAGQHGGSSPTRDWQ